jgi:hypothetical protein
MLNAKRTAVLLTIFALFAHGTRAQAQAAANPTGVSLTEPAAPAGATTAPIPLGGVVAPGAITSTAGGVTTTTAGAIRSSLPGTTSSAGIGRLSPPAGLTGFSGIGRLNPPGSLPSLSTTPLFQPPPNQFTMQAELGLTNNGTGNSPSNSISGAGTSVTSTGLSGVATSSPAAVSGTGFSVSGNGPGTINPTNPTGTSLPNPTGSSSLRTPSYQQ